MVDKVKAFQRMSASHKEAWYRFVQQSTWGGANFDPNRHDDATLAQFIQMADAGQIQLKEPTGFGSGGGGRAGGGRSSPGGPMVFNVAAGKPDLVNQVKNWQKQGASHKEAWYRFVQEKSGGANFDPNRHDDMFLREFLQMAEAGLIELKAPTGSGGVDFSNPSGGMVFNVAADFQELVDQVKTWQIMSASHKEAWYRFVRGKGEGNFDPSRHDDNTLREFLQQAEAGQIKLQPPTGYGSSKGWGGGGDDWETQQVVGAIMAMMGKGGGRGGRGWGPY